MARKPFSFALILHDVKLWLFGECKSCLTYICAKCKKSGKKGIVGTLDGYIFSENAVTMTVWIRQIIGLLKESKDHIMVIMHRDPDYVQMHLLELYKGQIIYVDVVYQEYKGPKLVAKNIIGYSWEGLLTGISPS